MSEQTLSSYNSGTTQQTQAPVMTLKNWVITLLILSIPLVNIIMLVIWAIDGKNPNRTNFCRASLIVMVLLFVLYFGFMMLFGLLMLGSSGYY